MPWWGWVIVVVLAFGLVWAINDDRALRRALGRPPRRTDRTKDDWPGID